MKIGIGSYAFRYAAGCKDMPVKNPMSPFDFLQKAKELGAEAVQICDNMPVHDLTAGGLQKLAATARDLDLLVEIGIQTAAAEQVHRYIRICTIMGVKILRMVVKYDNGETAVQEGTDILQAVLPALQRADVVLAVENHFVLKPADIAALIKKIDSRHLGVCLDPLNSIVNLVGPEETICQLAPLTVSSHIKDAVVNRAGTGFNIQGCPLGHGRLDLDFMIKKLKANGLAPNIFLEAWMDAADNIEQTLRQEEQWISSGLKVLREKI